MLAEGACNYKRQAVSPEREVITMAITFAELIQFVIMLTGVITLCYLIFHDKKK